jgi:hypothetical protein
LQQTPCNTNAQNAPSGYPWGYKHDAVDLDTDSDKESLPELMRKPCKHPRRNYSDVESPSDVGDKSQRNHLNDRHKPALPSIFQTEEFVVIYSDEEVKMPMIHSAASIFPISCCCDSGDGNAESEVQEFIQCEDWHHVACQQDGQASNLSRNDHFVCDNCDMVQIQMDLRL